MSLRRGFKSEANAYAREFRAELGLSVSAPLCPWALARHLEVPIVPLSHLRRSASDAVRYLMTLGRESFHAVTVGHGPHGTRRTILHNDGNALTRQASDIAHELSHVILGHPLDTPFDRDGNRCYNQEFEAEARWMGPALLVSEEAALAIVREGISVVEAAARYKVSHDLIDMRLNVTGARKRGRYRRARRPA